MEAEGGYGDMDADLRSTYVLNATLARADEADAVLLVGSNPRTEAPLLNARLRRAAVGGAAVGVVGPSAELTYAATLLGAGPTTLKVLQGTEGWGRHFV